MPTYPAREDRKKPAHKSEVVEREIRERLRSFEAIRSRRANDDRVYLNFGGSVWHVPGKIGALCGEYRSIDAPLALRDGISLESVCRDCRIAEALHERSRS